MDFEEFMGMMSVNFTNGQLDELSFQLPWDIRVTGYSYGDFSGDGLDDFVIAVKQKDKTPEGTVDVYFLKMSVIPLLSLSRRKIISFMMLHWKLHSLFNTVSVL